MGEWHTATITRAETIARHKSLHLSAMGAAIPHLLTLVASLPDVLPFGPEQIHTEILTGTVEVQDEIIPEDDNEDISYETRGKSTLSVVVKIGDGVDEERPKKKHKGEHKAKGKVRSKPAKAQQFIMSEPQQEDPMDTL
jgi:ribonuclease P/MRP protein subunit RPP20